MSFESLINRLEICKIPISAQITSLKHPKSFLEWVTCCRGKQLILGDFRVLQPWSLAVIAALSRREVERNIYPVITDQKATSRFAHSLGLNEVTGNTDCIGFPEKGRTVKLHRISKYVEIESLAEQISILPIIDKEQGGEYIDEVETKETIKYIIIELLRNVVQHSCDEFGGIVIAQRMDEGEEYVNDKCVQICVVDLGIGIFESLKTMHPDIRDNNVALERSIWPSFSGKFPKGLKGTDQNAGMGLFFISEMVKRLGGRMLLASRSSSLFIEGDPEGEGNNTIEFIETSFPGTLIAIDIPKRSVGDFEALIKKVQETAFERSIGKVRVEYIIFEPENRNIYTIIKVKIGNEDTVHAEEFSKKYLIPMIEKGKPICLDFSGYRIVTQSYLHAILFNAVRRAYDLKIPLAIINSSSAVKDCIILLEWYTLGTDS